MDLYVAFTDKQSARIKEWKSTLPKKKQGTTRLFSILFFATGIEDKDGHFLFKAVMKTSDGHKFLITKKAALH
jgi:hypothetical protein